MILRLKIDLASVFTDNKQRRKPSLAWAVAMIALIVIIPSRSIDTSTTEVPWPKIDSSPSTVRRRRSCSLDLQRNSPVCQEQRLRLCLPLAFHSITTRVTGRWSARPLGGSGGGSGGRFPRCIGSLRATTTVPPTLVSTSNGPAEGSFGSSDNSMGIGGAGTVLTEDGSGAHLAFSLHPVGPSNDTLMPSQCNPHLVSDILDIASSAIPMHVEFQETASADVDGTHGAAALEEEEEEEVTVFQEEKSYAEKDTRAMVKELVAFTLPLLAVWLSNPIMSLVDTAVVGAQSFIELAALGPGTSLCDNTAYMCGFLAQVTTNLGASALADGDSLRADRATRTGLFVAFGAGLVVSSALLFKGRVLLQLVLGSNPLVSEVLPFSCSYVYIRALGFVAVTMSMVLQGAYLARKDVVTPIKSVAGASVVNLVLDCVAVFVFGMGIKGAALATTAAQWAGLAFLMKQFLPDMRKSGKVSFLPYRKELSQFLSLGAPTCLALSGQVASCISVTVAASGCDTIALAAHQVLYGVFLLFCPIGEAVSQTVQTFLPAFTVERPKKPDGTPSRTLTYGKPAVRMMKLVSLVALGLGVVDASLAALLTAGLPSLFTPDKAVWAAMRSVAPLCGMALVLHGITLAFQGAMMATREVLSTATIYSVGSILFTSTILLMRRSSNLTLSAVWKTFVIYQVVRCATFAATVGWSHRTSLMENLFTEGGSKDVTERPAADQRTMEEKEEGDASSPSPGIARLGKWPRIFLASQGVTGLLRRRKQGSPS